MDNPLTLDARMDSPLDLDVRMDRKTYRDFMVFDSVIRIGSWRRPLLFALIFTGLAAVSFAASLTGRQGALLGAALLLVGLGPALYFFFRIYSQINQLAEKLGLKDGKSRLAYRLVFDEDPRALLVRAPGKEELAFPWADMMGAWRRKEAVYLYVKPGTAYLVPKAQAAAGLDAYWAFLKGRLPPEKMHSQ